MMLIDLAKRFGHDPLRASLVKGRRKATPDSGMTVAAWNVANPDHPKDAEGRWTETGDQFVRALGAIDSAERRTALQQVRDLVGGVIRDTGSEDTPLARALTEIVGTRSEDEAARTLMQLVSRPGPADPAKPLTAAGKRGRAMPAEVRAELDSIYERPMPGDEPRVRELLNSMTTQQIKDLMADKSHTLGGRTKAELVSQADRILRVNKLESEAIRLRSSGRGGPELDLKLRLDTAVAAGDREAYQRALDENTLAGWQANPDYPGAQRREAERAEGRPALKSSVPGSKPGADPARPLTSTSKPERATKPAAAQVVAEIDAIIGRPMSSDRERLAGLLNTMTLPQLKEFAERRSHVLQAGVKKTKINRLVENMIGHRLNSESIRFASFEDYTGGRRRKRLDEIRARLRELDAIGPAGREEYGRLHHERVELITGGAGDDEMAEFRQRAGSPIPADRPTRSVRGRVNPAVGGQFRDAPDPARPLTASGTSRVAQPETALDRPDPPAEAAEVAANVTDAVSQFPAGKYDTNIRSIMSGDDLSSDANRDRARQLRRIADNADQVADMRWANSALNRPGDKERRASAEDDWMRAAKLRELADALDQLAAATERLPGGGADPKV